MGDKEGPSGWVAVSFAALIAMAAALFAMALRRAKRIAKGENSQGASISQAEPATPAIPPGMQTAAPSRTASPGGAVTTRWTPPTKYIMSVVLFLVALAALFIGRAVIPMVLFAAILALFINPFILMLSRRLHLKWTAAVALTYVLVILVLILIPLLLFPNIVGAVNFLLNLDYQQLADEASQSTAAISASLQSIPVVNTVLVPLLSSLAAALKNAGVPAAAAQPENVSVTLFSLISEIADKLGALRNILGPVVSVVVSAFFVLLMGFQMSLAANQISGWYPDLIPPAYKDEYSALFDKITGTWINFLRGQLTLMLIIGVIIWLGGALLGLPFPLLMGLIAGLLELIPSVGPTLAAIPAVLLALVLGSTYLPIENVVFALLVIGFYVLVQLIENQFVVPHVMGEAVDLPPLIVLIGTLAGATAFGILGALLATPVIATGNLVFRYVYRKILEPPPLPPEPEEKPSIWSRVRGWAGRIPIPGRKNVEAGEKPAVAGGLTIEGAAPASESGKSE
jgi:predicted PurR-regulated permease PerM